MCVPTKIYKYYSEEKNYLIGRIIKGVGGFFHVTIETAKEDGESIHKDTVIICNSKGIFRKDNIKPLVGDIVEIDINHANKDENETTGIIKKICERKNFLIRPPIANIDVLFVVVAAKSPSPTYYFIDKMTAIAVSNGIAPVIIVNKTDLLCNDELSGVYNKAGIKIIKTSAATSDAGFAEIKLSMASKVCAFAGASGVGKSTLLNKIFGNLNLETGGLSEKIERGKHTTRTVEFFRHNFGGGDISGYVADTPGFSVLDFEKYNYILKEDLLESFPDLNAYADKCKYTKCSHTKEEGCNVIQAVSDGAAARSRHESYIQLYEQVKNQKEWEIKKS